MFRNRLGDGSTRSVVVRPFGTRAVNGGITLPAVFNAGANGPVRRV